MATPVEKIRAEMPLPKAWRILGLPGQAIVNHDMPSPLREDKSPSFRLYQARDHVRWHDHGTGEGGDIIDLWAAVRQITNAQAIADILRYLGDGASASRYTMPSSGPRMTQAPPPPRPTGFRPPSNPWHAPTPEECATLAALRGLLPGAFDLAGYLGTLKVGMMAEWPSWFITDPSGICAEARRMDGELYPASENKKERKAWALARSNKHRPVGLITNKPEWDAVKNIVLVAGGPDYFAALSLAIDSPINFRPAAMLGEGTSIDPELTLPYVKDRKIIIIPHNDPVGAKASEKWAKSLVDMGAEWVQINPVPYEINDLIDYLKAPSGDVMDLVKDFSSDQ